jgi:hypothetical protein
VTPALEPDLQGSDRVRAVFARVGVGDLSVADLYAEHATIVFGDAPDARVEGREAIRAFYEQAVAMRPQPRVEDMVEVPPFYAAVVDVPVADGHIRALDVFEVDDGGIRSLRIFSSG